METIKPEIASKRINYIDVAKGIGILMVLLGHLIPDDNNPLKSVIYSFHMPLFFIVSGMTLRVSKFSLLLKKRFYSILLPYLLWAMIFSAFSFKNCAYIIYGSNESLQRAGSNAMLWFLASMFFGVVISGIIIKVAMGKKKIIAASAAIMLLFAYAANQFHDVIAVNGSKLGLPWAMDVTFLATSFILAGNLIAAIRIENIKTHRKFIYGCILLFVSLLGIVEGKNSDIGYPQMATFSIGNTFLYGIVGIVVSIGIILLSSAISDVLEDRLIYKALVILGQHSMIMFILHCTLVYQFKSFISMHSNPVVLIIFWVVLTIYSVGMAYIIGKICPVLAGKGLAKSTN